MNRLITGLMLLCAALLLGASLSGFMSDAELSSSRLGSDFADSHFQQFDGLSVERAQQRTRREQVGLEAVAGLTLMLAGLVIFTPKRKIPGTQIAQQEAQTRSSHVSQGATETLANKRATEAPAQRVTRRRPNGSIYAK